MLDRFDDLHATLLQLMADHESLCAEARPRGEAIATIRWHLAQCGHARARLMVGDIVPAMRRHGREGERAALNRFATGIAAYQAWIGDYARRWPTATILAEWPTYRAAAADFRRGVRARVVEERTLLRPVLVRAAATGRPAAPPIARSWMAPATR